MELKQKELLFDIETSPNLAYVWGKWEQDVIEFVKEKEMISFAYKWTGKDKIISHSLANHTPRQLTVKLHKLFNKANVIVAHNGDEFDIKNANTFFVYHNLKPPSPYKTIDTLKIAKSKFKFNSNKLDDLARYLGIGRKIITGGFQLWKACLMGNKIAYRKMEKYNRQDVVLLDRVLKILRVWAKTLPYNSIGIKCSACGSSHIQKNGWRINRVFKKQRYHCQDCGRWGLGNRKIKYKLYR